MSIKDLVKNVTGTTNPISISINDSHDNAVAIATIKAEDTTLNIGDAITVQIGYGSLVKKFSGFVKRIERSVPDDTYVIVAHNALVRAVDYYLASANPNTPFKRFQIQAEDLIRDLLLQAGLTNYSGDTSNFTYAWTIPVEFNLVGVYDACKQLADMLAWHIYADENGQIHFLDRKPYVMAGDTPVKTVSDATIISASETTSDDELRNRIIVYGGNGVYSEAKASSPYLPAGYYKTTVLSAWFVDRQDSADKATSFNLTKWNRLRKSLSLSIEGDTDLSARDVITVQQTDLGINSDWYIYQMEHNVSSSGYVCNIEARQ